jgi:hypothetical protein
MPRKFDDELADFVADLEALDKNDKASDQVTLVLETLRKIVDFYACAPGVTEEDYTATMAELSSLLDGVAVSKGVRL